MLRKLIFFEHKIHFLKTSNRCVPFYGCTGGLILTNGATLIGIRGGLTTLDPTNSKCHGDLEICCRQVPGALHILLLNFVFCPFFGYLGRPKSSSMFVYLLILQGKTEI